MNFQQDLAKVSKLKSNIKSENCNPLQDSTLSKDNSAQVSNNELFLLMQTIMVQTQNTQQAVSKI